MSCRTAWYALAIETDGEHVLASDIEQVLEEDAGRSIPGCKVTAVQVSEQTHDRLAALGKAFVRTDEATVDPIEESAEEVLVAYRRWLPRPNDKRAITDLAICVDRFEHRLREGREHHVDDGPGTTGSSELRNARSRPKW